MNDIHVRPATTGDYAVFASLFPELGVDDPTPTREAFEERLRPATVIAERSGEPAGYGYYELFHDCLYVRNVVTAPQHRRKGVGRALMHAMAERGRAAGITLWCLNVRADNEAARVLYEAVGLHAAYQSVALRFAWSLLDALPTEPLVVRVTTPQENAALEQRLQIPAGQLESASADPKRYVLGAFEGAMPAGVACFAPGFPGAFPFRAARPTAARALLEACRQRALPDPPYMQVVIENDTELEGVLIGAGAQVRLRFAHHRGLLK